MLNGELAELLDAVSTFYQAERLKDVTDADAPPDGEPPKK